MPLDDDRLLPDRHVRANYDAPSQRPWRDTPPDLAAIAKWTTANERAHKVYLADTAVADGLCGACLVCKCTPGRRRCAGCHQANRPELGARP